MTHADGVDGNEQAHRHPKSKNPMMKSAHRVRIFVLFLLLPFTLCAEPTSTDHQPIVEALGWVRGTQSNFVQYDYVMTARVRLIFFWAGKDDVGGGYIRRGISKQDSHQEFFQVLFGSDPAKAPRGINRWGAGTEVELHKKVLDAAKDNTDVTSSAFFGFMKSSKGKSVAEMQSELKKEKEQGEHQFTGIVSRVDGAQAMSLIVPLASNQDYNLHQYDEALPIMLEHLNESERPVKTLEEGQTCSQSNGFLGTVAALLDEAANNAKMPASLCYFYDAQMNTLILEHVERIAKFPVKVNSSKSGVILEKTYEDLFSADFVSVHKLTGKRVNFTIVMGTKGHMRGVPVLL